MQNANNKKNTLISLKKNESACFLLKKLGGRSVTVP